MGEVLSFNPPGWPDGLAPGPAHEVEHVCTIHGVRVSIARQDDSGLLHVVVADAVTMNATGVAIAQDDDGGRRLARFVARAVIRALDAVSWVSRPPDADSPSPEADHA